MNNKKVVIAIGGNVLQEDMVINWSKEQQALEEVCKVAADIHFEGYEIGIVHGSGPQIGRLLMAMEPNDVAPPIDQLTAMIQGSMGHVIKETLTKELAKRNAYPPVVVVPTSVEVDEADAAFNNPTKPIGPFYTKEEALKLADAKGYAVGEDAGRGYRRLIPSPAPLKILEADTINKLWDTSIVISCGGGGIPVAKKGKAIKGMSAVVDKDYVASMLAKDVDADILLIITGVENVYTNFGGPNEEALHKVDVTTLESLIKENQFAEGSMLPKIKAATEFVKLGGGRRAIITDVNNAVLALKGNRGTIIE